MNATDKSRAIDKIKKLLALATDKSANEHEAANAMRQARSMMAQHNLDEGVFDTLGATQFGHASYDTIWCVSEKRPVSPFMNAFIGLLRNVFNVTIIIGAKPLYRNGAHIEDRAVLNMYGDKVDVQLCEYSAAVVWRALNADREVYAREHSLRGLAMARQREVLQSYSIAWLNAARTKLEGVFWDPAKRVAAKAYSELMVKTSSVGTKGYRSHGNANSSGAHAGSQFNISRPVGAQQKALN